MQADEHEWGVTVALCHVAAPAAAPEAHWGPHTIAAPGRADSVWPRCRASGVHEAAPLPEACGGRRLQVGSMQGEGYIALQMHGEGCTVWVLWPVKFSASLRVTLNVCHSALTPPAWCTHVTSAGTVQHLCGQGCAVVGPQHRWQPLQMDGGWGWRLLLRVLLWYQGCTWLGSASGAPGATGAAPGPAGGRPL
jgi:hypothetical protein